MVSALVSHIIRSWREHFARSVAMKFNCFFLMPFVDEFPFYLRNELDRVYEGDNMNHLFDISEVKASLKRRRDDLAAECKANERLQGEFDDIEGQVSSPPVKKDSELLQGLSLYIFVGNNLKQNSNAHACLVRNRCEQISML